MEQETKRAFSILLERERYRWGNKPDKQFANILKDKKTAAFIAKIKHERDELVYPTPKIAKVFTNTIISYTRSVRRKV